ncbi:hypothetical protein [Streptomyces sp. NPDC089919]|uniref:hypothetical protein n=1 Tax=Streptomyces sp. NPDC089919 TaxID=3155188 RepID=UPI003447DFE0
MARKPPGALRAADRRRGGALPRPLPPLLPALSSLADLAVRRAERRCLWPGATAEALAEYRDFIRRQPGGGMLELGSIYCPCCHPAEFRDRLALVLERLPAGPRRELAGLVAPLDEEFRRRTRHDPGARARGPWYARHWWRQRVIGH